MGQQPSRGVAVVTGASAGIGAVYADRLAARGYDLILVARRLDRLQALSNRLAEQHGRRIEVTAIDLADAASLALFEKRLHERDDIEILVNNAGVGALGPSSVVEIGRIENLIRLNVIALTRLSLAGLRGFRRRNRGGLINIASMTALSPLAIAAAYCGSKAYILNFTRSLQLEFAQTPINVQVVLPGPIRTEFFAVSGVDDSFLPQEAFLTAEQLVDAALQGHDRRELITIPSLPDTKSWDDYERVRDLLFVVTQCGDVAARYRET